MEIISADISQIDLIRPLWEQLTAYNNDLHERCYGEPLRELWEHKLPEFVKRAQECRIKLDIVTVADRMVGYCLSSINKHQEGEVVSLFILPEFRGRGTGGRLMNEHVTWFRENEARTVHLYVHPVNTDAFPFYWRFRLFSNSPLMELCPGRP